MHQINGPPRPPPQLCIGCIENTQFERLETEKYFDSQHCVHKRFSFSFSHLLRTQTSRIYCIIVLCFMSIVIVIAVVVVVAVVADALASVPYLFLFSIKKTSCFIQLGWSEFCEMLNELTAGPMAIVLTIKLSVLRWICERAGARTLDGSRFCRINWKMHHCTDSVTTNFSRSTIWVHWSHVHRSGSNLLITLHSIERSDNSIQLNLENGVAAVAENGLLDLINSMR